MKGSSFRTLSPSYCTDFTKEYIQKPDYYTPLYLLPLLEKLYNNTFLYEIKLIEKVLTLVLIIPFAYTLKDT